MDRFAILALVAIAPWAPSAMAQAAADSPAQQLQRLERELGESRARQRALNTVAKTMQREIDQRRASLMEAAAGVERAEESLAVLEGALSEMEAHVRAKTAALEARRGDMAMTLSGLVRMSRQPPQALVLAPGDAFTTVRTAQLAAATIPAVEARAQDLRRELASLADARLRLNEDRAAMARGLGVWTQERERMAALQGDAVQAWRRALADHEKESRNAAQLAESAKDLQTLLARLTEAERQKERRPEDQLALRTPLPQGAPSLQRSTPARGRVVARFGDTDGLGGKLKGVRIETRKLAPVVAPSDGKVAFAGPFRGYGLLLIIEHDGGYHTLLGGLARIDSLVGQWVLAGEPVGEMGDDRADRPSLYVEVRHKGEPVNPLPWLASGDRKVSG